MADVAIWDVRKSYGAVATIHGVSVDIADGEFVILVGPSGCGKSTLLRMLAGLEEITGGEMRSGGQVVNDLPPKDRDIAMVFQNYALCGFPRWRGGPMQHADTVGLAAILVDIEHFAEKDPFFWQPAPLLTRLVAGDRRFASEDMS